MPTYRLVVEYDGTDFRGFQFQTGERTVAGELERALAILFDEPVALTAAGRTDAGVHAVGQVVSFTTTRTFPVERIPLAANAYTPPDIGIRSAAIVADGFSARFDAIDRTYEYLIFNRPVPSPLVRRSAHHVWKPIDHERFAAGAEHLIGEFDMLSFCGVLPERGGTVRSVSRIVLDGEGEWKRITVTGNAFVHRQVRIMVGTLIEMATHRRDPEEMPAILAARDRRAAGYTAPAEGLYFAGVRYPGFSSYAPARA